MFNKSSKQIIGRVLKSHFARLGINVRQTIWDASGVSVAVWKNDVRHVVSLDKRDIQRAMDEYGMGVGITL